jgi:hypothetical protein
MPLEGYTAPGHNSDGTSPGAGPRSDPAAGSVDHVPAAIDQAGKNSARVANAVVDALAKVTNPQDISITLTDALAFASLKIAIAKGVDDVVPDVSVQQRLSRLPAFLRRDLKRCAHERNRWRWWTKLCPSRRIAPPAPARNPADNAGARRLRLLVRQQSRRGPPREEQGDEPPALGGPRRPVCLVPRRSPDAVHCPTERGSRRTEADVTGQPLPRRPRRRQPPLPGLAIPPGPPRCHRCEDAPAMPGWRLCPACYEHAFRSPRAGDDQDSRTSELGRQ